MAKNKTLQVELPKEGDSAVYDRHTGLGKALHLIWAGAPVKSIAVQSVAGGFVGKIIDPVVEFEDDGLITTLSGKLSTNPEGEIHCFRYHRVAAEVPPGEMLTTISSIIVQC